MIPFEELLKSDKDIIESLKSFFAESKTETLMLSHTDIPSRSSDNNCSSTKGLVMGKLCFRVKGDSIDCSRMGICGITIPCDIDRVEDIRSDALFILVVENDFVFYRLEEDGFYDRFPCIIIYADGHPDTATILFLERLRMEFKLPVLALIDSDPHLMRILSAIPDIKWLGLRPTDLDKFGIDKHCRLLRMTNNDITTGKELLEEEFVKKNPKSVSELERMIETKQKAEIESLSTFGFRYLTEVYLPLKLQQQDSV